MSASEKKSKRNGIIGTILFHALLLIAFLFLGLTYQDPPPPEEGISINFGFMDEGVGEVNPEAEEETIKIVQEEVIEQQIESNEEIVTQTTVETPAVETTEEKKEEVIKDEPLEEVKPEVNIKALYPGKKENSETSEGDNNSEGTQGIIEGDPDASSHEGGGIGEDGTAYQLGDREVTFDPPVIYESEVEGKVAVRIIVDPSGKVFFASPGEKGTTTSDQELSRKAKNAALKRKYKPIPGASNQQGIVIYTFKKIDAQESDTLYKN